MSILGKLKYILLLIIITYSYLIKILDKLISLELAIGSSLSQKANLIFSFLFALIFYRSRSFY